MVVDLHLMQSLWLAPTPIASTGSLSHAQRTPESDLTVKEMADNAASPCCHAEILLPTFVASTAPHTILSARRSDRVVGWRLGVIIGGIPIGHPLPDVSSHVQCAIGTSASRMSINWSCVTE